jgi:ribosomal protein L10
VSKQRETKSKLKSGVEAVPWAVLLRGGVIVGKRWTALSAKERVRLAQLVRESRGRVSNLSVKQRLELRKLARKLDLKGIGRELMPLVRRRRGRKRR